MQKKYVLVNLLNKNNFISYNKNIAHKVSVNAAVLFGQLIIVYEHFRYNEFYFEQDKIVEETALSKFQIKKAADELVKSNILKVTRKGELNRNWYDFDLDKLFEILGFTNNDKKEEPDSGEESESPVDEKVNHQWSRNCTTSGEESESLLNKEKHEKNLKENLKKETVAKREAAKKQTASEKKQQLVEEYLASLSESDNKIYQDCVSSLYNKIRSRDPKFGRRECQLREWQYQFAKFSETSGRSANEIYNTLLYAINDSFWTRKVLSPTTFQRCYETLFQQAFAQPRQSSSPRSYQQPRQFDENHLFF